MPAVQIFGERQQELIRLLLHQREGRTVEQLAEKLGISRNAVNQHLASLQASGHVESKDRQLGRGRPSRLYGLTAKGLELFPRHYDMFSNLLVGLVRERIGSDELRACMRMLGKNLAADFVARVAQEPTLQARFKEAAAILEELGYEAHQTVDPLTGESEIVAFNCVFHKLAEETTDVCQLDLSLLTHLLDGDVELRECMVKGGSSCRFGLSRPTS